MLQKRKEKGLKVTVTEDVCLVCFSMRLADRKERFLHAQKGGRAGDRNKFK